MRWPAATLRDMQRLGSLLPRASYARASCISFLSMPVYEFKCARHGVFSKTATSDRLVARCTLCHRLAPRLSDQPTERTITTVHSSHQIGPLAGNLNPACFVSSIGLKVEHAYTAGSAWPACDRQRTINRPLRGIALRRRGQEGCRPQGQAGILARYQIPAIRSRPAQSLRPDGRGRS